MSNDLQGTERYRLWPVDRRMLTAIPTIGLSVGFVLAALAYAGGALSPERLTQTSMIKAFEEVNSVNTGFRRNHAKGVCVSGRFDSNGNGVGLSKAAVFKRGAVPVIGRFAVAVGRPFVPDNETEVRSMALSFRPPGAEEWRTGMNDIPVFSVKDAKGFYDQLLASQVDSTTGKPDPEKMKAFFVAHPESQRALQLIQAKPFSTGFGNASYNSLDAFRFVNAEGVSTAVRWSMVAIEPFAPEIPAQATASDKNYLFDALIARIEHGPLQWRLVVTVGGPGDPTNDATIPWPEDRQQVDVGTLTIDHIEAEGPNNCRDVNFDPLVLPPGIEPSDDPLLSARSAVYSTSFTRRAREPKTPSEVQIPGKGG
ncbi:MAG TPA: catalase family peroxidase [Roseiarcus sp.]|nr:catalase family peroxidase [Roseiarcus sp.]